MDTKDTTLKDLPYEVIEYILDDSVISYVDLCRIASVSRTLNCIAKDNDLWRNKYKQMWPNLAYLFEDDKIDWKNECFMRHEFKKKLAVQIENLAFHKGGAPETAFEKLRDLTESHPLGLNCIIDELDRIIESDEYRNLTVIYNAKRALRYMQHNLLRSEWQRLLSQKVAYISLLIQGVCFISKWYQATELCCTSQVPIIINSMCEQVFEKVKQQWPEHPLIKKGILSSDEVLRRSLWNSHECRTVLCCVNTVMFQEMKFSCTSYDSSSCEDYFVEKVITERVGAPIILSLIYWTVAAKLGVNCLLAKFPVFVLLLIDYQDRDGNEACPFIDMFDNGAFKSLEDIRSSVPIYEYISHEDPEIFSPCEFLPRIPGNFYRVLNMTNEPVPFMYCHVDRLIQERSYDDINTKLMCSHCSEGSSHPKDRHETERRLGVEIKYAVGMVMKNKEWFSRGVIVSWFHEGDFDVTGVTRPVCYELLLESGLNITAEEDELEIDRSNEPLSNFEVGKYFESFNHGYYLANEEKRLEYPEEAEICERALNATDKF